VSGWPTISVFAMPRSTLVSAPLDVDLHHVRWMFVGLSEP